MKTSFRQIYIAVGINFPFSHHFQRRISQEVTAIVVPSEKFIRKYGMDFNLIYNISAKTAIHEVEIKGPTVFRKTKDVEYTLFLPYDEIVNTQEIIKSALCFLFEGVVAVLNSLGIDSSPLIKRRDSIIGEICADPLMVDAPRL